MRRWSGWVCPECCSSSDDPLAERDDDGTLMVTCPDCGNVEVHVPEESGHHV